MQSGKEWHIAHSMKTKAKEEGFWDAIEIWLKKPHVVNRRLCGAEILWQQNNMMIDTDCLSCVGHISQESWSEKGHWSQLLGVLTGLGKADDQGCVDVYVRDLLPKQLDVIPRVREVVMLGESLRKNIIKLCLWVSILLSFITVHL